MFNKRYPTVNLKTTVFDQQEFLWEMEGRRTKTLFLKMAQTEL